MAPSTNWQEIIAPDEDARFTLHAQHLVEVQKLHAVNGKTGRAVHFKSNGGFEARFEVLGDLPEHARHGIFAQPKVYDALVRYSNGASEYKPDAKPDVRGFAIKLLNVDGPKAIGTARTQDFLAILQSTTPFRNADEFVGTIWATRNKWLALPRLFFTLGFRMFTIVPAFKKAVSTPSASLADQTFHSALPIMCGPYAVRFRWQPLSSPAASASGPDQYADDLASRLRQGAIEYALELQFFVDETRTPIEDGSIDWPIDVAPYVRVGKLTIPQQDAAGEQGKQLAERIQNLSFDPWHALAEHRPLGNMMRARKYAYFECGKGRNVQPEP